MFALLTNHYNYRLRSEHRLQQSMSFHAVYTVTITEWLLSTNPLQGRNKGWNKLTAEWRRILFSLIMRHWEQLIGKWQEESWLAVSGHWAAESCGVLG